MNEIDKTVAELCDEKWLWDLALLHDVTHHLNDINTKLQGQQELIFSNFGTVRAFE
jgi:hypothetical protein